MRAGVESAKASVACTTSTPSWLRAPAGSVSPASLREGIASPVMCSELTSDAPCTTLPSSATCKAATELRGDNRRGVCGRLLCVR